jgi:hypothetical protein
MEGGVAILLLLILVAVIGAVAFVLTGTGGALSLRRRSESKTDETARPTHTEPTTPYHEHTSMVGVDAPPKSRED